MSKPVPDEECASVIGTPLARGPIDSQVPIWQSRRACRSVESFFTLGRPRDRSVNPCKACASANGLALPEQMPSTQWSKQRGNRENAGGLPATLCLLSLAWP